MLRSMLRVFFALAVSLSLAFGVFSGVGTSRASAAGQPTTEGGYNPAASVPTGMGYCYPSGYNRNGWRCGWRLAAAPYNLGSYNGYYSGYYNGYGYYGGYYNSGTGGYPGYTGYTGDYGGNPRFGTYYYYSGYYYNPCYYNNDPYCYGYRR